VSLRRSPQRFSNPCLSDVPRSGRLLTYGNPFHRSRVSGYLRTNKTRAAFIRRTASTSRVRWHRCCSKPAYTADDQATVAPLSSLIKKRVYVHDEQPWTTYSSTTSKASKPTRSMRSHANHSAASLTRPDFHKIATTCREGPQARRITRPMGSPMESQLFSVATYGGSRSPRNTRAMGHESQIEARNCFAAFRTDWPGREEAIKTSGRGTQTRYATLRSKPSSWGGRQEQVLLNDAGWKARKHLATEMYLFLIPSSGLIRCGMH